MGSATDSSPTRSPGAIDLDTLDGLVRAALRWALGAVLVAAFVTLVVGVGASAMLGLLVLAAFGGGAAGAWRRHTAPGA